MENIIKYITYKGQDYKVLLSSDNTRIIDSYQIKTNQDMTEFLFLIRKNTELKDYACCKRSIISMIREWRGHNLLFALKIFKKHTRDVDFEYPQKWYFKIGYYFLSMLYYRN